jgi:membrane-bound metal-dependent hydrolase YbcI (DUF457 family)
MNRQAHLVIGMVLFLLYFYAAGLFRSPVPVLPAGELFACGIIAVSAGSLFPDLIEPATNARHRGIFHSRRALKLAGILFLPAASAGLFAPGILRFPLLFALSCFLLGWAAHLLADSVTRAGLPA